VCTDRTLSNPIKCKHTRPYVRFFSLPYVLFYSSLCPVFFFLVSCFSLPYVLFFSSLCPVFLFLMSCFSLPYVLFYSSLCPVLLFLMSCSLPYVLFFSSLCPVLRNHAVHVTLVVCVVRYVYPDMTLQYFCHFKLSINERHVL